MEQYDIYNLSNRKSGVSGMSRKPAASNPKTTLRSSRQNSSSPLAMNVRSKPETKAVKKPVRNSIFDSIGSSIKNIFSVSTEGNLLKTGFDFEDEDFIVHNPSLPSILITDKSVGEEPPPPQQLNTAPDQLKRLNQIGVEIPRGRIVISLQDHPHYRGYARKARKMTLREAIALLDEMEETKHVPPPNKTETNLVKAQLYDYGKWFNVYGFFLRFKPLTEFMCLKASIFDTRYGLDVEANSMNLTTVCSLDMDSYQRLPRNRYSLFSTATMEDHCKDGLGCKLISVGSQIARPYVMRSCCHNEIYAVVSRICGQSPWMDDVDHNIRIWRNHWRLPAQRKHHWVYKSEKIWPTKFELWNREYPLGQRKINEEARLLNQNGLPRKAFVLKAFVKTDERNPVLVDDVGAIKKPRIIQGRSPQVKVLLGPWMDAVSKAMRKHWAIGSDSKIQYASGCTAEEVGIIVHDAISRGWVALLFDGKAFDASVGPGPHLGWANQLRYVGVPDRILRVVRRRAGWQSGVTKYGVRYRKLAQVNSGDGDTSCGNTSLHGEMWIDFTDGISALVLINGDDSVCLVSPAHRRYVEERIANAPATFGFRFIKAHCAGTFDITFCSGRFWKTSKTMIFGPMIGRVVAKTFWSYKEMNDKKRKQWLRGLALSMVKDCNMIPILRIIFTKILASTRNIRAKYFDPDEDRKIHASEWHVADQTTFDQLNEIYGIPSIAILDCERHINSLDILEPQFIMHPVLDAIVHHDLSVY